MNHRRTGWLAGALALVTLAVVAPARASVCRDAEPTGATAVVAGADEPGERMLLTGRVVDPNGRPMAGVTVYVFHTDAKGYYSAGDGKSQMDNRNPRLCGVLRTDAKGAYRVETIRPARYATGGPEPHVHFEAWRGETVRHQFHLTFRVTDRPGGEREAAAGRRADEERPMVKDGGGTWHVVRDLVFR